MLFDLVSTFPGTSTDSIWEQYLKEYFKPNTWKYPKPEEWRRIFKPAETNFEVSSWGRVRNKINRKLLKPSPHRFKNNDRLYAQLCFKDSNGNTPPAAIHRLVAKAFLGEPQPNQEVCHWNDIGVDNRKENLRWDIRENNLFDSNFTGKNRAGAIVACADRSAGYWKCDLNCKPDSEKVANFKLELWRLSGRTHPPYPEKCYDLLERYLSLIATEAELEGNGRTKP